MVHDVHKTHALIGSEDEILVLKSCFCIVQLSENQRRLPGTVSFDAQLNSWADHSKHLAPPVSDIGCQKLAWNVLKQVPVRCVTREALQKRSPKRLGKFRHTAAPYLSTTNLNHDAEHSMMARLSVRPFRAYIVFLYINIRSNFVLNEWTQRSQRHRNSPRFGGQASDRRSHQL